MHFLHDLYKVFVVFMAGGAGGRWEGCFVVQRINQRQDLDFQAQPSQKPSFRLASHLVAVAQICFVPKKK